MWIKYHLASQVLLIASNQVLHPIPRLFLGGFRRILTKRTFSFQRPRRSDKEEGRSQKEVIRFLQSRDRSKWSKDFLREQPPE